MDTDGNMSGGDFITKDGLENRMAITTQMLEDNNFEKMEHLRVRVWISHTRRGDVEVEVVSPSGIKSVLAGKREHDDDDSGYQGWTFMSVKHW
jgi:kexin